MSAVSDMARLLKKTFDARMFTTLEASIRFEKTPSTVNWLLKQLQEKGAVILVQDATPYKFRLWRRKIQGQCTPYDGMR